MKKHISIIFALLSITVLVFCAGRSRTVVVKQFAAFEMKADLATKQLYYSLSDQGKLNTSVNILLKARHLKKEETNTLRKLGVKVKSESGDIQSVYCEAKVLPQLADLNFIIAIEAAKNAKLR
ncbi:hypothetical protein JXJ21_26800 [candidate division KSB1 bacterium]|nr:hypothetical protein [candidate division KSB1 bacterium]